MMNSPPPIRIEELAKETVPGIPSRDDCFGADIAVRAGTIHDHHRLTERLAEIRCDQTHCEIRGSPGAIGNDDPDQVFRIFGVRRRDDRKHSRKNEARGRTIRSAVLNIVSARPKTPVF